MYELIGARSSRRTNIITVFSLKYRCRSLANIIYKQHSYYSYKKHANIRTIHMKRIFTIRIQRMGTLSLKRIS